MLKTLVRRICSHYAVRAANHGDLKTAVWLWATAIAYGDNSPETQRNLGELYLQSGNYERAGALLSVAASSAPLDAALIAKLARAYQESGEFDKAKTHWLRVRELDPGAAPLLQLAIIHHRQGDLAAAADLYAEVIRLDRNETEAHLNLGKIQIAAGRLDAAQACLERALDASPAEPQVLCCLGEVKAMQGELDQAIAYFAKSLEAAPDFAPALANMGLAMQKKGQLPEAAKWLREANRIDPRNINAWLTLGVVYREMGQLAAAIRHQEQALALFPHHPRVLSSLGACHAHSGNYAVAETYIDRALAAAPDLGEARVNRAFILLMKGDYRLGFAEYESRLREPALRHLVAGNRWPTWRGEPLAAKAIVLRAEQGFGDAIQFIRFATNLVNLGATVLAEASPPLLRLLAAADGVSSSRDDAGNTFEADFSCPIMSLPHRLDVTLDTLPASVPYFRLQTGDVERWKGKLAACKPLKVGIAWASNPDNWISIVKSVSLEQLLPILSAQGISFFSLQVGVGGEQLKQLPDTIDIIDPSDELTDFYETACLIANLDLVIAIDSAVAHLAGALGKPVWVLLHHAPDWRWLLKREDSLWYPSARLFRQHGAGDWQGVIDRVHAALLRFSPGPSSRPVTQPTGMHGSGPRALDQMLEEAIAVHRQGKLVDAERLYKAVLQVDNGNFDALHLLGMLLAQQGRCDEAVGLLNHALRQNPLSAEAHSNLGNALNELQRHEEAIASHGRAIALKPEFAEAHYNIGNALYALGRHEEAVASYRSALAIRPDDVEVHNNLGLVLSDLNRQGEAIALLHRALQLKPDFAEAHWNRGLALLTIGDLDNGWEDYEWRWQAGVTAPMQDFPRPLWLGAADLRGTTVLLHADQGFGDTIQFVRYAPMVAARGARVVLQVLSPLKELMTSLAGVDTVVSRDDALPAFDCHCPLSSLPRVFGTRLEDLPGRIPYLRASAGRMAKWEALLAGRGRPRIGLTWSGNRNNRKLRHRAIAFERLLPLLSVPGMCFVSLQKDLSEEDAAILHGRPELAQHGDRLDDFADTAAAVSSLDLVISVDTAIVHLAGALGKPVWVLLPFTQDWRWLLEREDSPWYPSARLFRQPRMGDWDGVLERVRIELLRFSP